MNKKIVPMLGIAAIFGSLSIFAANMWLENAAEARAPQAQMPVASHEPQVDFGSIVVARQPLVYGAAVVDLCIRILRRRGDWQRGLADHALELALAAAVALRP